MYLDAKKTVMDQNSDTDPNDENIQALIRNRCDELLNQYLEENAF
jgi:hypothetical protein